MGGCHSKAKPNKQVKRRRIAHTICASTSMPLDGSQGISGVSVTPGPDKSPRAKSGIPRPSGIPRRSGSVPASPSASPHVNGHSVPTTPAPSSASASPVLSPRRQSASCKASPKIATAAESPKTPESSLPASKSPKRPSPTRVDSNGNRVSPPKSGTPDSSSVPLWAPRMRSATDSALCSSLREVQSLRKSSIPVESTCDTYKMFKQKRQQYISRPRTCSDNFKQESYSHTGSSRGTSRTTSIASGSSSETEDKKVQKKPLSSPTRPLRAVHAPAVSQQAKRIPARKPTAAVASTSLVGVASTGKERASSLPRSPRKRAVTLEKKEAGGGATGGLAAASVSSLNSDDLMLTTEIGLDEPDDDIIKDIDDTEKEDPFLAAAVLSRVTELECTAEDAEAVMRLNVSGSGERLAERPQSGDIPIPTCELTLTRVREEQEDGTESESAEPAPLAEQLPQPPPPHIPDIMSASYPAPIMRRTRSLTSGVRPRSFTSPLRPPMSQVRRERALSAALADDGEEELDESAAILSAAEMRNVSQDVTSVKTLLLKLKRMLVEDEGHQSPLDSPMKGMMQSWSQFQTLQAVAQEEEEAAAAAAAVDSGLDLGRATKDELMLEVLSLRGELADLRSQMAEKDQTVRLLQRQMSQSPVAPAPVDAALSHSTPAHLNSKSSQLAAPSRLPPTAFLQQAIAAEKLSDFCCVT